LLRTEVLVMDICIYLENADRSNNQKNIPDPGAPASNLMPV
jgi:hypothetical protein